MENINIETLKLLSCKIIEEECKRINEPINYYPVTIKEYYQKYVLNFQNIDKEIFDSLIQPIKFGGFNDQKGNIVIFIDKINKLTNNERKIFITTLYSYHEAKHSEQKQLNRYSYERFIYDIENYLIGEKQINNKKNHKRLLMEIDANMYAITKTKEYLINNYPAVYQKEKEEISLLENKYSNACNNYDPLIIVEKIIDYMRYQLKIHFAESVSHMEIISPVLKLFLYPEVIFKPIRFMMKDERFQKLDKRIIYTFLSSKQFLKTLNIDELNKEELILLNESLEYTKNKYLNQDNLKNNIHFKHLLWINNPHLENSKRIKYLDTISNHQLKIKKQKQH